MIRQARHEKALALPEFSLPTDIAADRCYDQAVAPHPPMSEEQLKAFLEKVKGDTTLQEQLNAATNADAVVEIAKASGFVISTDDWNESQSDVSDEELEAAVGGAAPPKFSKGCHREDKLERKTTFKSRCEN